MSRFRILHLLQDWLFTDGTVSIFKTMPVENRFVVLNDGTELKKVKSSDDVEVVQIGSERYNDLLKPGQWDVVWVFGVTVNEAEFVKRLDRSVAVVWSVYGIDYVDFSGHWLYGLETTKLMFRITPFKGVIKSLAAYVLACLHLIKFVPRWNCRFFKRVDYFSCVVPTEESWIRRVIGSRKEVKRVDFHYTSATADEMHYPVADLKASRIWVGNSATLTNNHLEVFAKINGTEKNISYDILVPLSYSRNGEKENEVTRAILEAGERNFGERFKPIRKLMGLKEYVKLMSSCSVFIFGHRRQQSVGNVLIALKCGGCVFLDPRNPVYRYFLSYGVIVYPISRIKEGVENIAKEFMPFQQANIKLVNELRDNEKLMQEIRDTVSFLEREVGKK